MSYICRFGELINDFPVLQTVSSKDNQIKNNFLLYVN